MAKVTKRSGTYRYYVGRKSAPDKMSNGDAKVYKLLRSNKHGLAFKDIVARLKMPPSTVD